MPRKLMVVGEYNAGWETHQLTDAAIEHSQSEIGRPLEVEWCSPAESTPACLENASGFWIATGAPYKSMDRALEIIRYARENSVPCLGTCQGFQHIMLEYARAFLHIDNPGHQEYESNLTSPFITELPCSLRGRELEINIADGSYAHGIYGASRTTEKFYCNYGINPEFASHINSESLCISGVDSTGEIRIVEYREHPFMVGTLFVPQARSRAGNAHPLITAFIRAVLSR